MKDLYLEAWFQLVNDDHPLFNDATTITKRIHGRREVSPKEYREVKHQLDKLVEQGVLKTLPVKGSNQKVQYYSADRLFEFVTKDCERS